jgi:mannose-6-phosphate isomerase-like protein (cupin superfamily)
MASPLVLPIKPNLVLNDILFTQPDMQIATKWIPPLSSIPLEIHPETIQSLYIIKGHGSLWIKVLVKDFDEYRVSMGDLMVIPKGWYHEIRAGNDGMFLLSFYSNPNH